MKIEDMRRLMQDPSQLTIESGPNIFAAHAEWLQSDEWRREVNRHLQKMADDWSALAGKCV